MTLDFNHPNNQTLLRFIQMTKNKSTNEIIPIYNQYSQSTNNPISKDAFLKLCIDINQMTNYKKIDGVIIHFLSK